MVNQIISWFDGLTSTDKGVNVLDLAECGVVAVQNQGLNGVQEAIHVDDGSRVLKFVLDHSQTALSILVHYAAPLPEGQMLPRMATAKMKQPALNSFLMHKVGIERETA